MAPARKPARSGLTLLELVITVALLATLGVLALPGFGSQMDRQRLRHAAQTFAGDIAEARFLAAQRGQTVYLQSGSGPAWCWSVAMTPGCECGAPQSCRVHAVGAADHPGVRLVSAPALQLDPMGMAQSTSGAVFESARGERLRVDVSPQGRPRICTLSGNWPQIPDC